MAAATTNHDSKRSPGDKIDYHGASGYTYFTDTMVMQSAGSALIIPLAGTSGVYFLGVVENKVALGTGNSQAMLHVWKTGEFEFDANGTGASSHIGRAAYAIDDKTVGISGGAFASVYVGEVTAVPTSSTYRVRIDQAVGTRGISGLLILENNVT